MEVMKESDIYVSRDRLTDWSKKSENGNLDHNRNDNTNLQRQKELFKCWDN